MAKDIFVLTPNGRRQKVHCTPDTSMLQVLEEVCLKQGFQATDYNLKHHNHILDLTITIRFSNLPNKAMLEMVEAERKREETIVTIGLLLEDGERKTGEFSPSTSLYDLVNVLAPAECRSLKQPTILYMRQEVSGEMALKQKTLRHLGLIGGRAILRLLNKSEEARQANVSTVYRVPQSVKLSTEKSIEDEHETHTPAISSIEDRSVPGPSNIRSDVKKNVNPINLIKKEKTEKNIAKLDSDIKGMQNDEELSNANQNEKSLKVGSSTMSIDTRENFERRLNIEDEVTFLGAQKAIAFTQPDNAQEELNDLPDDFYELTIEEVRRLYHDLQQNRLALENTPLITASKREELATQTSQERMNLYKNVVVRIQFPDHIILQGVFTPTDKIEDVVNFIRKHLKYPEKQFHVFTTPLKEMLDPTMTLQQAKFVPCVHMHFKWLDESNDTYLKEDIYTKQTSSDAASILASKYRAPSRRKSEVDGGSRSTISSTSKDSKLPKWFKK